MSKHDYHTSTVDGARAHAERHAEPDHDDDRPTNGECLAEDARAQWLDEELPAIVAALEDISCRLSDAIISGVGGQDDAADRLDAFIESL